MDAIGTNYMHGMLQHVKRTQYIYMYTQTTYCVLYKHVNIHVHIYKHIDRQIDAYYNIYCGRLLCISVCILYESINWF